MGPTLARIVPSFSTYALAMSMLPATTDPLLTSRNTGMNDHPRWSFIRDVDRPVIREVEQVGGIGGKPVVQRRRHRLSKRILKTRTSKTTVPLTVRLCPFMKNASTTLTGSFMTASVLCRIKSQVITGNLPPRFWASNTMA